MKRFLIQAGLMVGSLLVFGAAVNAQISQQYRAEVPFDFQADGVAYSAGDYTVGPLGTHSSVGPLAILDQKNNKKRLLGQTTFGGDRWERDAKLIFVRTDGRYTLSEIVTPTFGMKIKERRSTRLAKNDAAKAETLAVELH